MGELSKRLRFWRWQRFQALWAEGAVRFLALLGAYLLGMALMDRFFMLPQQLRWGGFGVGVAAFVIGSYWYLLRPLRALGAPNVLGAVGRRIPDLAPLLNTAWELGHGDAPPHTSAALIREHLARTERKLREISSKGIFPLKPTREARRRLSFVAAAWGIGMPWLYNGQARFERILAPWRDVRLETLVRVEPGDGDVVWGHPAEIRATRIEAHPEGELIMEVKAEAGSWRRVPFDRVENETRIFTVEALREQFEYRIGLRDLRTRAYRINPLALPRLNDLTVRVHLPGGQGRRRIDLEGSGEIAALRRSWVVLRGRSPEPLESAQLAVSYLNTRVKMRRLPDGQWEGGFPLHENGTLALELRSAAGVSDPEPVKYALRALEDEAPKAELLSPAFELEISPKEKLPVTYEASDDYGLSALALVYSVKRAGAAQDEKVIPLIRPRDRPRRLLGDYLWDLARLPLGSQIEFRIRATDNARPQAQTSVSEKGILRLVDFESAHLQTEKKWMATEKALSVLAAREEEAAGVLEALAAAGEEGRSVLENQAKAASRSLDSGWERAVDQARDFAEAMKQDPLANPGMAENAQAIQRALEHLRSKEFEAAKAKQRSGALKQAARSHRELAQKVRRAGQILNEGRELQAMQDFWNEAHRMDQAGSEISQALSEIAKSGKAPTAEQRRALDKAMAGLNKQLGEIAKAIEQLPKVQQDSPRDSRRKVYRVPLNRARRTMSALEQALAQGDYQKAAEIAEQLAKELNDVHQAISRAAQDFNQENDNSPSAQMAQVGSSLRDAIEKQRQALQMTERIEQEKVRGLMKEQQRLLEALAELQRGVLRDSGKLAGAMPLDALAWMKMALQEFEAKKVRQAPKLLERIIQRLNVQAVRVAKGKETKPERALLLEDLSAREADILKRLKQGAKQAPMTEAQLGDTIGAGTVQRKASRRTEEVREGMGKLTEDFGLAAPETIEAVNQARQEQASAEKALSSRDTRGAQQHQQRALDHLNRGQKSLQKAQQQQQAIRQGIGQGFGSRRGVGRPRKSRSGADTGFVPLPGAEDYQPPREIRKEIERSLQEGRPEVFDDAVDDYLRRMSQ